MAENNNVIGLAMQLDVTDIKTGIKEVNKTIKSAKDEFTNATAGMDMWSKSSEGLNAKLSQLGKQLNAQQKAVSGYEAEIERVKNLEGDHSTELEKLNEKLQKAKNAVKNTQSQMSHYGDSLKAVEREEKDANSALGKLTKTIEDQKKELNDLTKDYKAAVLQYGKNSREAKDLARKIKDLSGEIEDNEKKVESADKAFDGLSKSFEDIGGKAVGKAVKGLAKLGAAVAGVVGSFLATAEGTREFRTNMGKVNTAFDDAGLSAEQAESTYKKFYGILGDEGQATEAVSHLAKLANNQKDLAKWTDIAAGVYGVFGDSLPIENLTEAANETAKTGQLTGGLADALNWVGISEDKFQDKLDACSTEQERQKLITDTLTKSYGEASKQYQETNKDIIASQEAQAELSQAMADIGARAEPLMTAMKEMGTQILQALLPVIDAVIPFVQDHLPAFAIAAGAVTAAVGTLAAAVGVLKLKTELATVATVAKTAAEKAAALATKGVTAAQWLLNAALSANPIGIVIVAITALVAAFVVLWKKSDSFRNFWKKLWEDIKKYSKVAIDAIAKFFSACWDGIKKAWNGAGKFFSGVWKNIKDAFKDTTKWFSDKFKKAWDGIKSAFGKVGSFFSGVYKDVVNAFKSIPEALKKFFTNAWDKIKSAFNGVTKFFSGVASDAADGFKSLPDKMKSIGKNLVEGLWNGVSNMASWISGKLKGFSDNVLSGIKKFFKVNSPSKATAEIGGYLAEGLIVGIENETDGVIKAGTKAGNAFAESVTKGAQAGTGVKDSFGALSSVIDDQKEKLSRLENQYKSAVMTFGESSTQANALGIEIISLSREIAENEIKVKSLDDSYKGLTGTLANQMRIELNNAKNRATAIQEQQAETQKLLAAAGKANDIAGVKKYGEQLTSLNSELSSTQSTVKELTANLDYMAKVEADRAANAAKTADKTKEKVVEQKNAYEQLVETIENQRTELEKLKAQYGSAVITLGKNSSEASNLATKIKLLTKDLEANEQQVEKVNQAFDGLSKKKDVKVKVNFDVKSLANKIGEKFNEIGGYVSDVMGSVSEVFDAAISSKIDEIDNKIDTLKSTTEKEIAAAQESADAQLAIIDNMYNDEQLSAEEYRDRKKKIEDELSKYSQKKNEEAQKQEEKLLKEKDKLARKQFLAQQANEIATATLNGASAIIKGFAELGPIAGAINAAVQAGITATQIGVIARQKYVPMLAKGGIADGATLAMIGENGREAVMPLENNTGWINELAQKLNEVMQKDLLSGLRMQPAYAMANGAATITNNYYQTINSPKALTRREIYRDSKNLLALKG